MLNCKYLRYYHEAINSQKTKNYHKISGATDSLYSQPDLFLPIVRNPGTRVRRLVVSDRL